MTKYFCLHCRKHFSRVWNRDRHVKDIHRKHPNQELNRRILESNEYKSLDPLSIEFNQNTINTRNVRNSYQKEATYHNTGIIGDNNGVQDYVYCNAIHSNFQSESDIHFNDEKIEFFRLVRLIQPKLWMLRRLFPNPNSPPALYAHVFYWTLCISEQSSRPLDDILRRYGVRV